MKVSFKLLLNSVLTILMLTATASAHASETLTPEPDEDSYNFVTHYRVHISAPVNRVWPALLDLKSWMYEFMLSPVSGIPESIGHVMQLYEGRDFRIQITAREPMKLLAISNLPMIFEGEFGTGVGIITLHQHGDATEVALTMSRRYTWREDGINHLRIRRSSAVFKDNTRAMWQGFLNRLKTDVERNWKGNQPG